MLDSGADYRGQFELDRMSSDLITQRIFKRKLRNTLFVRNIING